MSSRRGKYDIEMQTLQTLGQKLVAKRRDLQDYACNVFADKMARIDLLLLAYEDDEEMVEWLKGLRTQIMMMGEALWIMNADVLTNLGLKVGRTGRREISGKRKPTEPSV